ncbi:MAG: tyrosine-type recombinase/integrase [Verrucomicrobiia bacterium]
MNTLSVHLDNYLKLRRQLGFQLRISGLLLRKFVLFADREKATFVTTKLALRWATQPADIRLSQGAVRMGIVRRFALYLSAIDPRTEVPPPGLLPCQFRRRTPHLYRDDDIVRLMAVTRQIDHANEFKGATYATLFGLLAVTGMRLGEALALDRQDVDLKAGLITVRRAKGNKSRFVPLHPSAQRALQQYVELRDQACMQPASPGFLLSERGTRLLGCTVNRWFLLVACQIGLRKPGGRRGPRVHDLRHYFAVRTLLRWYRADVDVEVHLPELSTYLGHVHVRHTYWYLSAVPELLKLATLRWQHREGAQ